MKLQIKVKYLALFLGLLGAFIWAFLSISGHRHQLEVDRLSVRLYSARDSIVSYQIQVGGLEETVYQSQLVVISRDKEIFDLEEEGERLRAMGVRRLDVIARLETEIAVLKDSLKPKQGGVVSLSDMGIDVVEDEDKPYLPLPNHYIFEDADVMVRTDINIKGLGTMDMKLRDPVLTLTLGSTGVFKKQEVALVTSDNPYVVIDEANVVVVDKQKAPVRTFLVGTAVGVGLAAILSFVF